MLMQSNSYKYSTFLLIFLWTATAIAEDYVDIWCGLDTSTECGECGLISTKEELDQKLKCAFGEVKPIYTFTASVTGQGKMTSTPAGIDCGSQCTSSFKEGTSITLSATPNNGHQFSEWQGACSGAANPVTMMISNDSHCSATFVPVYTFTANVTGQGKVTSIPAGIDCGSQCTSSFKEGTSITLSATPNNGQQFSGWQGTCSGTTNPLTMTMSNDSNCSATFVVIPPVEPEPSSPVEENPVPVENTPSPGSATPDTVISPGSTTDTVTSTPATDKPVNTSSTDEKPSIPGTNADSTTVTPVELIPVSDITPPPDNNPVPPTTPIVPVIPEVTTVPTQPETDSTPPVTQPEKEDNSPLLPVIDATATPTTTITPPIVIKCDATAAKSDQRNLALTLGESAIKLTIANMKGELSLKQAPDSKIVDLKLPFIHENAAAQIELTPRAAGQTQLTVSDCQTEVTVNITVSSESIPELAVTCDPEDETLALHAVTQEITLHVDDPPLTTILAGGQGNIQLQPYLGEVATIDTDFSVKGNPRLTITPRQEGTAQVVIEDCAKSQAIIKITVKQKEVIDSCKKDGKTLYLEPHLVLLENEEPITLIATGGQSGQHLTQAPNGSVVTLQTLDFFDDGSMRLILAPRKAGKTTLLVADCANNPVSSEIIVLKPGTPAYLCYFANKMDGVCKEPDYRRLVHPNSSMVKATGELVDDLSQFTGELYLQEVLQETNVLSSNETGVVAKFTVWVVDENHWSQKVDLLQVVMHETEDKSEFFTSTGETWQNWNGDLAELETFEQLTLPAILETSVTLDNLLKQQFSGKFTVYLGYRLENGQIVFNGKAPLQFGVENRGTP